MSEERAMGAKEFHSSRGDLIIPLYAWYDKKTENVVAPSKEIVLAAIYKFAEAYAAHLQSQNAPKSCPTCGSPDKDIRLTGRLGAMDVTCTDQFHAEGQSKNAPAKECPKCGSPYSKQRYFLLNVSDLPYGIMNKENSHPCDDHFHSEGQSQNAAPQTMGIELASGPDMMYRCSVCGGSEKPCKHIEYAQITLAGEEWVHQNCAQVILNFPKPCGICDGVIQSATDLDWHGYGNCRDIPGIVMADLNIAGLLRDLQGHVAGELGERLDKAVAALEQNSAEGHAQAPAPQQWVSVEERLPEEEGPWQIIHWPRSLRTRPDADAAVEANQFVAYFCNDQPDKKPYWSACLLTQNERFPLHDVTYYKALNWPAPPSASTQAAECYLCGSGNPSIFLGKCAEYHLRGEPAHIFHWSARDVASTPQPASEEKKS